MGKFIDFMHFVGKLKTTKRTGWIRQGIKDVESVAEHSYRMAIMCMLLGKKLGLDENKLIKMALVHDLAEASTGDIVIERGDKIIKSHKERLNEDIKIMEEKLSLLEEKDEIMNLWMEYEKQETIYAKVLKQIDKIEMVLQALEYEKDHHDPSALDEFWINAKKYIENEQLVTFFEKLTEKRK